MSGYDPIAWVYSQYWGAFSVRRFLPVLERLLLPRLPEGARILDLGCGTGNLARELWERGYQVTGVDISPAMVREARKLASGVEFVQGDMRKFSRPATFHAVVSLFATVNHLPGQEDLLLVLEKAKENLVEGGWLVFDFNTPTGLRERWEGTEATVEEDLVVISRGRYDEKQRMAETAITALRAQEGVWLRSDARVSLHGFEEEEVEKGLRRVGFGEVAFHRAKGKVGRGRVFVVCRKPSQS